MRYIQLTRNKVAIVDDDDYESLSQNKWYCSKTGYAVRTNRSIRMHRVVMNAPEGLEIDHINGNRLDNRKSNLRICDHRQNTRNRTTAKGYSFLKDRNQWQARVQRNGKNIFLGNYNEESDARKAYLDYIAREKTETLA